MNRHTGKTPGGLDFTWGDEKVDFDYKVHTPKFARKMKWSTEPPKVEGWYWVKIEREPEVVYIQTVGYGFLTAHGHSLDRRKPTHWLGPLPLPEPPQKGE
jgi:hypothetical protein